MIYRNYYRSLKTSNPMKTSNYILIAIFILVIACILTFFITAKQYKGLLAGEIEILLPDTLKVIVAEKNTNFDIRDSDKNALIWKKIINGPANFHISNDTLFLDVDVKVFRPVILLNHYVPILKVDN